MTDLVEIARSKIIRMGGSQYILVPPNIRQQYATEFGDELVFLRSAKSNDPVLKFEKPQTNAGDKNSSGVQSE